MKTKNGMTLIEIMVVVAIISIISTVGFISIGSYYERKAIDNSKVKIPIFLNQITNKSFETAKRYIIEFDFIKGEIIQKEKETKHLSGTLILENKLSFIKKEGESIFTREVTENGNFNIGFTVFIKNKNKDKIFLRLVGDNTNPAQIAMVKMFRPKGKAFLTNKDNLEDRNLWVKIK